METRTKYIIGGLVGAGVALWFWKRRDKKTVRVQAMGGVRHKRMAGPSAQSDVDAELSALTMNPSPDAFGAIHERCLHHMCNSADMDILVSDLEQALARWPSEARTLRGVDAYQQASLGGWQRLVHTLDVSDMGLGEEGLRSVLSQPLEGVVAIKLGGNALGERGLAALAESLPPSVKHLDLDWEYLGDGCVDVLCSSGFQGVQSISCRNARLSHDGRSRIHERFDVALT